MRPTGWLAFFGLMLALSLLLGCTREVVKEVIVTPVAGPTATSQTEATAAPVEASTVTSESETENERPAATTAGSSGAETGKVYRIGIAEDLTTTNHWAYVGPDGTVWNGYVLGGSKPVLYGYSAQRFDWIPSLAADFPSPLKEETVDGQIFWTAELELVEGVKWSDGSEVTAEDFVFTAHTATELQLTGDWPTIVDPEYFDHAEANGPYSLKVYFKQKPGLARWQFGLAFMPIFSKSYWQPVVAEAKQAGDTTEQQKALYAHVPDGEPSAGGFIFDQWERGAFAEKAMNPDYSFSGTEVTQYANGAYTASTAGVRDFSGYGEPVGETVLEYTEGPYSESTIYSIYGSQDAAVLALKKGDIDFMLNPLGLSKGLQDQLTGEDGLTTIENASNGLRYLGFNFRKEPMDSTAFRQAVATLIDKEFLVDTVLQGVAIPIYTMVPEGNGAWYNPDVPLFGKGMTRQERIAKAVELLKEAGFTWETEPRVSEDGNFVEQQGEGLKMPNGEPVPAMEVMAPSPGYDPLRSTFAIWIERWLTEVGIPLRANLTGFNVIVDKVFNQQDFDMWILGWGLSAFPDYLESFFHSRHSGLEGHNPGGYNNPEFDRLADELLAETDLEAARQQVFKMQAFLAEDLPYVVLFDTPIVETYRSERIEFPYTETWGGLQSSAGLPGLVNFK